MNNMKKSKSHMKIIYDIDGFFSPANESANHKFIGVDLEPQPAETLFEQYYLGLRSAMFICEDTVEDTGEALDALTIWRKGCLVSAQQYVYAHLNLKKVAAPDFIWIIKTAIINELKKDYPGVENIQMLVSMRPRLSARVVDSNTIIFPALARTMLNHYNLLLVNSIMNDIDESGKIVGNPDMTSIARFMLPHLLFCHDNFLVQNLPIISAHSFDALNMALRLTSIQLLFILAHEHAHIHLKHLEAKNISNDTQMRIEKEADLFALNVLLANGEKNDLFTKDDVFTAIRWLFKYQLLEETVGVIIREGDVDFIQSKFEERRGNFQSELIINRKLKGGTLFEARGFITLVELQSILYESGPELIENIIDKLKKYNKTKNLDPWWEKIKSK